LLHALQAYRPRPSPLSRGADETAQPAEAQRPFHLDFSLTLQKRFFKAVDPLPQRWFVATQFGNLGRHCGAFLQQLPVFEDRSQYMGSLILRI
jgi:hypothetical protein